MILGENPEDLPYIGVWEIHDPRLEALVNEVLSAIPEEYEDDFPVFDLRQGLSPWAAHVEPDGSVTLDPAKLFVDAHDVIIGTIAHELAHVFLRHRAVGGHQNEQELEADDLAIKWGFESEVSAMIRAYGHLR